MFVCLVMKENEFAGEPFDKKNILTYGLPTQKSLSKMRTSMDVTPGYDENGKEFLTMSQKWAIVFYRILMPCVGSRREIISKLHYKKLSNIYTTSQEGYVLLELKNNWEKWTHLARKKFDQTYHFDEEREKDILSTLYTNSRFYSSMDGWSKEGMIEYNKLCASVRADKLSEKNSFFENWFSQVMQETKNESSEEREKVLNESRIVPYSDDWDSIENITAV